MNSLVLMFWHYTALAYLVTKFILRNLLGQSIRTSMQNLESVAQKMGELWSI